MNIINKKCVSTIIGGISGNVTYNGKTINIPRGSRFEMIDGKVLINGKPFEQYNEADCPIIKIEITGNVESIETASGHFQDAAVQTRWQLNRGLLPLPCVPQDVHRPFQRTERICAALTLLNLKQPQCNNFISLQHDKTIAADTPPRHHLLP